jgi:hypothetical protein
VVELAGVQAIEIGDAVDAEHDGRSRRVIEMSLHPALAGLFVDLVESAPHRVLAHHLRHAQQRRITGSQRTVVMCA